MAKCIPTTKSCAEIATLLHCYHGQYVQTTYDPVSTHAVYGFTRDMKDELKERVKAIGGKYIRFLAANNRNLIICCFALARTPEEEAKVKAAAEAKARYEAKYEKLVADLTVVANENGVYDKYAITRTATSLMNGSLSSDVDPAEYFRYMRKPVGKDEQRIYDIVCKACNNSLPRIACANRSKMANLAERMNKSIKDEAKRIERKAACDSYGLTFLGSWFSRAK